MSNQGSDDEVSKLFADALSEGNPQEPAKAAAVDVATDTVIDSGPVVDLKEEQQPPLSMPCGSGQQKVDHALTLVVRTAEPRTYTCGKCSYAMTADDYSGLPSTFGKVTCKSCNSKRSILSQMFGSWPIPEFAEMGKEMQGKP